METVHTCELCGGDKFVPILSQRDLLLDRPEPLFHVVRCEQCNLLFTNPRPSGEEMAAYYPEEYGPHSDADRLLQQHKDSAAPSWKRRVKTRLLEEYYGYPRSSGANSSLLERVFTKMCLRPLYLYYRFWRDPFLFPFVGKGRILDVGCGPGFLLARYRQWGWTPFGVELSPVAARYAREVLGLPVHQGQLVDAKFPSESMDVVVFQHALEHVPSPLLELREAHRILRKSGLLVVTVPNAGGLDARLFGRWWFAWDLPRHLYHFTPQTASALVSKAGFQVQTLICDRSPSSFVSSAVYVAKYKLGAHFVPQRLLTLAFRPVSGFLALLRLAGNMTVFCVKA